MSNKLLQFIETVKQEPVEFRNAFLVGRVKKFYHENNFTDEEILGHCNGFIEIAVEMAREDGCAFIKSRNLPDEIESKLTSALIDRVYWFAWFRLVSYEPLDSFINRLEEEIESFKAKAKDIWFNNLSEAITRDDANNALYYINEIMFQVDGVLRSYKIKKETIPADLLELKEFTQSCHIYLTTKRQVEPTLSSTNKKQLNPKKRTPSIPQIALLYIYTERHIDSSNAGFIVNKESEGKYKSGDSLIRKYNALNRKSDRLGSGPILNVSSKTREDDIKLVIDILDSKGYCSKEAKAELQQLQANIKQDMINSD